MIVTTPHGQLHELGALIIALLAAAEGWRVTYLGADLPADEIVAATMNIHPKVIALSIVYPANDAFLSQELMNLKQNIDPEIHIIVGGRISKNYHDVLDRIGATLIEDFDHFHLYLAKVERM
jgi:methanogenic corrinoid protein MtbC1